ncbi:T9SS type A sorting domain-containing protein [Fluviicola sp.]|uniref:T9SS type A sorting domain-containing protein n=1 Tax=Fluviicola sp. TaxID=1917219 RepID=UPI003D28F5AB
MNYGLKSTNGCGALPIDEPAGIDSENMQGFSIEPNPANTSVSVHSSTNGIITIRNSLGESVWNGNHSEKSEIAIDGFNSGIYFVEIENDYERSVQKLIIE